MEGQKHYILPAQGGRARTEEAYRFFYPTRVSPARESGLRSVSLIDRSASYELGLSGILIGDSGNVPDSRETRFSNMARWTRSLRFCSAQVKLWPKPVTDKQCPLMGKAGPGEWPATWSLETGQWVVSQGVIKGLWPQPALPQILS